MIANSLRLEAWAKNYTYAFGQLPRIMGRFEAPRVRLSSEATAMAMVVQLLRHG
jgi:hypothetical protein